MSRQGRDTTRYEKGIPSKTSLNRHAPPFGAWHHEPLEPLDPLDFVEL
jgi:hypothetical protein